MHIDERFPHDVRAEVQERAADEPEWRWRAAHAFGCAAVAADEWRGPGAAALAAHLAARLPAPEEDAWRPRPRPARGGCRRCGPGRRPAGGWPSPTPSRASRRASPGSTCFTAAELARLGAAALPLDTWADDGQGGHLVPALQAPMRPRARLTAAEAAGFLAPARPPARPRLCAARRPLLPPRRRAVVARLRHTPEIEQDSCARSLAATTASSSLRCSGGRCTPWASSTRTRWSAFLQGIGGCGKSTVLNTQMRLFAPHHRGVLSSNMQPQFGMSAVLNKGKTLGIILCNEVTAELSVVQEEWQLSVSGEFGSFAVKFGDPLVIQVRAQHFWVGNGFPSKFNNQQLQVSRRLAGVLMQRPVRPRDGNIMPRIMRTLGAYERKQSLAYFELVELTGSVDPMSRPAGLPPPSAPSTRRGAGRRTRSRTFCARAASCARTRDGLVLKRDVQELYQKYRQTYGLPNMIKFTSEVYGTPFRERDIVLRTDDVLLPDPVDHHGAMRRHNGQDASGLAAVDQGAYPAPVLAPRGDAGAGSASSSSLVDAASA